MKRPGLDDRRSYMRIRSLLTLALLIPIPVMAQKKCAAISDRTATREVISPPLAGIQTVVVDIDTNGKKDPYSTVLPLAVMRVQERGLKIVDSLSRADASLRIQFWPDSTRGGTVYVVGWERSYRNAAGQISITPVYSYSNFVPRISSYITLHKEVDDALFLVLNEREWQDCTK